MIAGLAYELIRFAGKHTDNSILMALLAPGLWLQRLTTREPTLDQIEVSIRALKEVLCSSGRRPSERKSRSDGLGLPCRGSSAHADVGWEGNVARGSGRDHRGHRARSRPAVLDRSRVGRPEGKTSPEELLAAAHAGCFAMSLAGELTRGRTPPERLDVTSTVVMDEVEGRAHQIVASELRARRVSRASTRSASPRAVEAPTRAVRSRR